LVDEKRNKYPYEWFEYLRKAENFVSPGIEDRELFIEIREALESLGMKEYEEEILSVISATLLLGNITVDASTFGNSTPILNH
jgi:myosin heavy subunit